MTGRRQQHRDPRRYGQVLQVGVRIWVPISDPRDISQKQQGECVLCSLHASLYLQCDTWEYHRDQLMGIGGEYKRGTTIVLNIWDLSIAVPWETDR